MENIYLDIGKEEQGRILKELWQKSGLTSRELAEATKWNRSLLFAYKLGRYRMPYKFLLKLCALAKVDVNDYSLKFVEINNQPKWPKLDLSGVDETIFQALNPEEWQKVVAAGVLTDGYLQYRLDGKYMLSFASSDKNLHGFFQKLVLVAFNEGPSSFLKTRDQNLWITYYGRGPNNPMIQKLLSFSKTYCTDKGREPSLDFLLNEREEVKTQALRFAMSCDGSVSIKKATNNRKSFALRLACAHPELNLQWQKLFQDIGISMNIDRDKANWSGIHGLSNGRKESFKRFFEIGGFLPTNVKVTNGNFIGMEKNEVLERILSFIKVK